MNKHTPGPWKAKPSVVLSENVVFWSVFSGDSFLFPHCNEADAHLMAAAPEMLEALKVIASHWPYWASQIDVKQIDLDAIALVRSAIAKGTPDA